MSTFLGVGSSVLFGNTVRASIKLLTDSIEPITPGGTINIVGLGSGHVVTTMVEFLNALALVIDAGSGCISVAAGLYVVNSSISLPSNIKIVGCGKESTIFRAAAGLDAAIFNINNVSSVKLQDLQIDSNSPNSTVATSDVIVSGSSGVTVESCSFVNSANSVFGSLGFLLNDENCLVKSCTFKDMDNDGVDIHETCSNINIIDSIFTDVTNFAIDSRGDRVVIQGNHVQSSGSIIVHGGKSVVNSNTILSSTTTGIIVNGSAPAGNHIVSNNIINDSTDSGIESEFASLESSLLVNNIIKDSGASGINIADNLENSFIDGNTLSGNASGINVSSTGNDNVCVGKNKSRVLYNAAGAISPTDDEAVVTAAAGDLAMTLANINSCSVNHCIYIENDAASSDNVSVTYNSGNDEIILLPSHVKVLKWDGQLWCVLNKDYFSGSLTVGQELVDGVSLELAFDASASTSNNYNPQFTGPIGAGQSYDLFVRTTGKYQVNVYATLNTAAANNDGIRRLVISYDAASWSESSNPYEKDTATNTVTSQLTASAVVNVSDLAVPIIINGFQDIAGAMDLTAGQLTIMRL